MSSVKKFELKRLESQSQLVMVEALAVMVFALFATAYLPQLLFQYVYANQALTAEPKLLSYIPVASFVIGALYFVYAAIGNFLRRSKISKLSKEIAAMGDSCSDCGNCADCNCDSDQSLAEMEKVVDEILSSSKKTKSRRNKKA